MRNFSIGIKCPIEVNVINFCEIVSSTEWKRKPEGGKETERNVKIYVKISCDRRMFSIPCFIPFEGNIYWQEICEWVILNLKHKPNGQLNGNIEE